MYTKILLAVDLDEEMVDELISYAIQFANTHEAKLVVATVIPKHANALAEYFTKKIQNKIRTDIKNKLNDVISAAIEKSGVAELNLVKIIGEGPVYQTVIELAQREEIDANGVIMIRASRPGSEEFLLGPNAAKIARHSKQSVLLVRR